MDKVLRQAQLAVLDIVAKSPGSFVLAGGTALELFYLRHRFSRDLDLFSPRYDVKEIDEIVKILSAAGWKLRLENELWQAGRARVKFYTMPVKGTDNRLKIDFVEDVFSAKPQIEVFNRLPVYAAASIYLHKIFALTGSRLDRDEAGREIVTGRQEPRDIVDIYFLSQKIRPLHEFLRQVPRVQQRGMVQWQRSYSRPELKLGVLDMEIYASGFDTADLIRHLDREIKIFVSGDIQ